MMPVSEETDMAISFTISVGLSSSLQAVHKKQTNVKQENNKLVHSYTDSLWAQ